MTDIWVDAKTALAALDRFPDIFTDEYQDALQLIAEMVVGEAVDVTPSGTGSGPWGHLANSIQAGAPVPAAKGWQVPVGTPAEYATVIEDGRKPGGPMPPISAIHDWVWQRRFLFEDIETEEDALHVAFAVAKNIAKNGFKTAADGPGKGWGMFDKAMAAVAPAVDGIAREMKERISQRCTVALNG